MKTLLRYLRIWWLITLKTNQLAFVSRLGASFFIIGKLMRFAFFLLFIGLLFSQTKEIGGYSLWHIVFLFLTFNLVDNTAQLLLREVYRFRNLIVTGDFDHYLVKPLSPLFRALFGGSDVLDIPILLIVGVALVYAGTHLGPINLLGILLYIAFIINALIIALSFHVLVLALGILSTEVDNAIMVYRDLTTMGRIPVDIYHEPVRGLLTFVIPIAIMMTFPYKALIGTLSWQLILFSFWIGGLSLFLSLRFWNHAINKYTSASS